MRRGAGGGRVCVDAGSARPFGIAVVADGEASPRDTLGIADVDGPGAGTLEREADQIDALRFVNLNQARAAAIVIDRPAEAFGLVLLAAHFPVKVPPDFAIAIDRALAGEPHVGLLLDVEQLCRPFTFDDGNARLHDPGGGK